MPLAYTRRTTDINVDGYVPQPHESMETRVASVGPDYLRTIRNPLVAGRDIMPQDIAQAQPVAVVNRAFAERYWRGADPGGRRIEAYSTWFTVVGVAETARYRHVNDAPEPFVCLPLFQHFDHDVILAARTAGDPAWAAHSIEAAIHELDPDLPVFAIRTLDSHVSVSTTLQRIAADFVGSFGLLSLVLAAVGLYAVVAYTTRQRTHETGVRLALGASRRQIFAMVLRHGLRMTAIGLVIGGILAAMLTRYLRSQLFGVTPGDPLTYASVALLLCSIAVLACVVPAMRASKVEPLVALRRE